MSDGGLADTFAQNTVAVLRVYGPDGREQEFRLTETSYTVGRSDGQDRANRFAVEGDPLLSRHHFDIRWENGRLKVQKSPKAKNPVFFEGVECLHFDVAPGQSFISGKSRFQLLIKNAPSSAAPTTEFTLPRTTFQNIRRPNITECFKALVELLPQLRESSDRTSTFRGALKVLRELLPDAAEFSILELANEPVVVVQELTRGRAVSTPPSNRLLRRAFDTNGTVTHVWAKGENSAEQSLMTVHAQADWAIASPIDVADGECFALYVVGSARSALTETEAQHQKEYLDDLASLIDIVAETVGHHLAVARLNRFEGQVGRFFSPALRSRIAREEFGEVLKPRKERVTVMFFDLRGFSKATEEAQDGLDSILNHHAILTEVMTTVTDCVFAEDGVVVDYQGDAVMACWGSLSEGGESGKAVRAARAILTKIQAMPLPFGNSRGDMRCGIGLATGNVIAGQVGAREQTKFGVLGPTVNLASRLEGLTKYFRVPILMNEETRRELGESEPCRCIGLVRPAGLEEACRLFELIVSPDLGGSGLSEREIEAFEVASEHYRCGRMLEAYETLKTGSRATDPVARLLTRHTLQYLDFGTPKNFDGVLEFQGK